MSVAESKVGIFGELLLQQLESEIAKINVMVDRMSLAFFIMHV